ncbi:stage II sporulation protein M [Ornithinibacillus sp. BX22]|uniref:Stage II sporulation protein M n=2 Tax=Ornithinibacillus TaxID=484508 RepID=A0A923RKC5_9BACI|nr:MULTISPECIES: stage II sporulation protein M [Ornithinibacillus]MBC5637132.1 stage II sporulation protein M [Ornithinibacillus hominis]MBS3679657.1 stage II sporulation protein M [Ornithinibacillus massiliensis]
MIKRTLAMDHLKTHATIYIFMIILFLTGIIFGAIVVNSMGFEQRTDLFFYVERFFGYLTNENTIANNDILKESYVYHARYLFLLFILGLSVIGLPIVWILIFLKGLVVGFSVGFIVNQLGLKGFLLATFSIAPQNILVIPIYIIAGSLSMIFTLGLLNKLFARKVSFSQPVLHPFIKYASVFAILLILSAIPALIEAYVANEAMVSYIKSLYATE